MNRNLLTAAIIGVVAAALLGAMAVSGGLAQASTDDYQDDDGGDDYLHGDDGRDDAIKYDGGHLQGDGSSSNNTDGCVYPDKRGYNDTKGDYCHYKHGTWMWSDGDDWHIYNDDYGAGKDHWSGVLSVTGYASEMVEPELLVVTLGVEAVGPTAAEALASNSRILTAVVDALNATGVSGDEVSTSYLNIYPEYTWDEFGQGERVPAGYRATNVITVTTAQLDKAADILDGAVGAGATRVESVKFTLSPETEQAVREGLISDAVSNARHKADIALAPLDYEVVGIDSIAVDSTEPLSQAFTKTLAFAADLFAESASPPVFSSDQTIGTAVTIVFRIGPE